LDASRVSASRHARHVMPGDRALVGWPSDYRGPMDFEIVANRLAAEPAGVGRATTPERGRQLYDHVLRTKPAEVLELGFLHGASTCYLAAALDEIGGEKIVTMDRPLAMERTPSLPDFLDEFGLAHLVEIHTQYHSYNWSLLKLLEQQSEGDVCIPRFDFCFIDGAHSWETDGLAFFLVAKLLRPGGWICFDDMAWTYRKSAAWKDSPHVQRMTEEEQTTPQVERVFTLLARQHPDFDEFTASGKWPWGWAHKREDQDDLGPG
jgi:predicted O-methyltransferase YrrM